MRNWNRFGKGCCPMCRMSLDRTYEELKLFSEVPHQSLRALFGSYLWGIETGSGRPVTSPKTVRVWIVPMRNWNSSAIWCRPPEGRTGLDRTYEELKHVTGTNTPSKDFRVWIVPMRNWNIPAFNIRFVRRMRLDRTYEELKLQRREDFFAVALHVWIVPMRNWNCYWNWRRYPCHLCLDRTYEELKL